MNADSEQLRVVYEGVVKQNPSDIDAVQYLAVWHLERHSFHQARKYFGHLATLKQFDADVWLCLSVCCAMADEFTECATALKTAQNLIQNSEDDVRVKFCHALMSEKRKDYTIAMEGYVTCLNQCAAAQTKSPEESSATTSNETANPPSASASAANSQWSADSAPAVEENASSAASGLPPQPKLVFMKELRGEVMLRIAVLKKEMGAIDQAMQMCNSISTEPFGDSIRANALCLKGLLHEMRAEFPASEVVYRSVLQITSGHSTALERLGRVYLRYRETIPAAVQCFFKSVETNPSNHVAWYLLGRCYMATSQYSDACEAYNRAVNLNPNDPQVWCSLGVLYYAFGQYREALGMLARALKLDSSMADAWYNVGALYDMCDQPEDAQQAYMKAKENGLADRFARAGMGLNPLAMQSLQFINNGAAGATATGAASSTAASAASSATGAAGASTATASTTPVPIPLPVSSGGGVQSGTAATTTQARAVPGNGMQSNSTAHPNNVHQAPRPIPGQGQNQSNGNQTVHMTAKAAAAARKQQLHQQQLLQQQQALQAHQLAQQQQQQRMKQLQIEQQALYHQQQAQQQHHVRSNHGHVYNHTHPPSLRYGLGQNSNDANSGIEAALAQLREQERQYQIQQQQQQQQLYQQQQQSQAQGQYGTTQAQGQGPSGAPGTSQQYFANNASGTSNASGGANPTANANAQRQLNANNNNVNY